MLAPGPDFAVTRQQLFAPGAQDLDHHGEFQERLRFQGLDGMHGPIAQPFPPVVQVAGQRPAELVGVGHQVREQLPRHGSAPKELARILGQRAELAAVGVRARLPLPTRRPLEGDSEHAIFHPRRCAR